MQTVEAKSYLIGYIEIGGKIYSGEPAIIDRILLDTVDRTLVSGTRTDRDASEIQAFSISFLFGTGGVGQSTAPIQADTCIGRGIIDDVKRCFNVPDIQDIVGRQAFALRPYNAVNPFNEWVVGVVPATNPAAYALVIDPNERFPK